MLQNPLNQKLNQHRAKLSTVLKSLSLTLAISLIDFPALAQINLATLINILGQDDKVFIENQVAEVRDQAALGEQVRTEQARAQLDFNTGATGRLAENSTIRVGQCVEVEEGVLVASGPANGCVMGFSAGVQGTIYVVSAETINNNQVGTINVLEGEIRLSSQNNPNDPNARVIREGQQVRNLTQGLNISEVVIQRISKEEYEAIITGPLFQGYPEPLPGQEKINEVCERLYGNCRPVAGTPQPVRGLW